MTHYKQLSSGEKPRFWQKHIESWQNSGQTQTEYCRHQKIKKSTLSYWRTRLSQEKGFVEIPLVLEPVSTIDIIIKDIVKLQIRKGFDPDLLIQAIKTLERIR